MPNDEAYTSVNPNDIEVIDTLREASGGGGVAVVVDDEMSWTSENPLQNKVITKALNDAIAGLAQDISDGLAERPTADELKPTLLYKGTIGRSPALDTERKPKSTTPFLIHPDTSAYVP